MSNDKPANEHSDAREDAFGELSRAGFRSVPGAGGEHAERLARMRARVTGGATSTTAPAEARVVRLRSRSRSRAWWAAAASALVLLAAALWQFGGGEPGEPAAPETVAVSPPPSAEADAVAYGDPLEAAEAADATERRRVPRSAEHSTPSSAPPTPTPPTPTPSRPSAVPGVITATLPPAALDTLAYASGAAEASPPLVGRPDGPLTRAQTEAIAAAEAQAAAAADRPAPSAAPDVAPARRRALPDADAPAAEAYALSRAKISDLRRVTGTVADDAGAPLPGATIEVEGTGQRFVVGEDGAFDLSLPPAGRVALVTVPDSPDSLYFDLTTSERFDFAWPAKPSPDQRPEVRAGGHSNVLAPLPARAPRNPAFEAYLDDADAGLPGPVELVFGVNRRGEVTGVRLGPTYDADRPTFRRARAVLEAGPAWPERYRRRKWRTVVR